MGLFVFSAGSNAHGQLAQGSEQDSHIFHQCSFSDTGDEWLRGSKILSIAAGANHTLALLRSAEGVAQLFGCGDGHRGQLGDEYLRDYGASSVFRRIHPNRNDQYSDHEITLVAAAWETSFVVLAHPDGDVLLSVGSDGFGDLGVGGLSQGRKETATWQVVSFRHLVPKTATSIRILQLESGPHDIIVKLQYRLDTVCEELIAGWGAARQGQLGRLPTDGSAKSSQTILICPHKIDLKSRICGFSVGNQHTVFLSSEGSIHAFGSNRKNQLCGLDAAKGVSMTGATWFGTYLFQKNGSVCDSWALLATGSNSNSQLARDTHLEPAAPQLHQIEFPADVLGTKLLSLACGSEHVLVALQRPNSEQSDGGITEVLGWGWNEHGNLGLGHTTDIWKPTRIWPNPNSDSYLADGNVVGIWGGCATSWIAVEVR